jgi:hypothetical protein
MPESIRGVGYAGFFENFGIAVMRMNDKAFFSLKKALS